MLFYLNAFSPPFRLTPTKMSVGDYITLALYFLLLATTLLTVAVCGFCAFYVVVKAARPQSKLVRALE